MAIHIEVRNIAMHPFAHMIGQPSHRKHILRAVKCEAIGEVEPLARNHLRGNWLQPLIVAPEGEVQRECGAAASTPS